MFKSKNSVTEMSSMRFKKSLLAVSIMALSVPSFAQTNSTPDENLEEVVVTGMRSSLNTAQELKRNADTVKDVITASDIGALPDKSVTEALQRVPGVTIERFASSSDPKHYADEGTGVLIRGLDRVRSEINGRGSFSANPWGGLSYEDFPAELLGAVEVVKNQTADVAAGGIAGTVNLITRKPLDSDERLISLTAKANYGDYREEVTPSFSALFSDNWETSAGTFGFLLAGSQSEFKSRGDGVGLGNFHSRGDAFIPVTDQWGTLIDKAPTSPLDGPKVNASQPAGSVWYVPAAFHMSTAENDRERTGFTTSLQWANTDDTIVATLEHINSEASLEWRERTIGQAAQGFKSYMGFSQNWSGDDATGHPLVVDDKGFVTAGIAKTVNENTPLFYRSRWNYNENTVEDSSFNLVLKPTDALTLEFDYQHIDSEKLVKNYSMSNQTRGLKVGTVSPYYLDTRGSRPTIEYLSDSIMTPSMLPELNAWTPAEPNFFLGTGMQQDEHNTAKADSFSFDGTYELDGVFKAVKAGVYYTDKDLTVRDTAYENFTPIGTPWVQADRDAASPLVHPELFEQVDFSDYYGGKVLLGDVNKFYFPKMDLVKNYEASLRQGCKDGWHDNTASAANNGVCSGNTAPTSMKPNRVEGPYAAHNISSTNEQRTEFYVRGDFEFDLAVPVKGNLGLRYVGYELESTGAFVQPSTLKRGTAPSSSLYLLMQQPQYKRYFDLAGGQSVLSTVKGTDYDTVLPSLNVSANLSDDVILRFGASKALFFPGLDETRNITLLDLDYTKRLQDPSVGENDTTNPVVALDNINVTALAGNPYLEPEESVNVDLSAEWYFASAGSVTVALFNKNLDGIIRNKAFDLDVTYGSEKYDVSAYGPDNTGSGSINGFELSYSQFYDMLPGAWSGLGLQLNYTYINQSGLQDPNDVRPGSLAFNENQQPVVDNRNTYRVFSGLPLVGYSDENLNIVGMYEYEDIAFRLAYTWRSEYLLTLRESEEFVPAYAEATGMVDASLYYTINDNLKIGIEGSNLLNTETKTKYQLNQAGEKTDALSFTTDRRYALSLRANF
jgi:iron complex outermembrane receptor protein